MRNRAGDGAEGNRKGCESELTSVAQRDQERKCSGGDGDDGSDGGHRPNLRNPPFPSGEWLSGFENELLKNSITSLRGGRRAPTRTGRRRRGEGRGSGWSRLRKWERVF